MAASCRHSSERTTAEELKAMSRQLFEEEYYSSTLKRQKKADLHIRLRTGGILENVDLEEKILEDVSNSNGPLSTVVLGDSGTGKSWLTLTLTKKLYDSTQPEFQNKIPLYIPLGRIEKMIAQQKAQPSSCFRSDILFSYIMNHRNYFPAKIQDGQLQNLYLDLCRCELILILDGYDELQTKSNLWEENNWRTKDFKNVRTIVSCRPNALVGVDVSKMFGFPKEFQCSYVILPLEGNVVERYISQVPVFLHSVEYNSKVNDPWMMTKSTTKDYPKWESAQEDSEYKYWFLDKLPELEGLAQNVFILTTICQLLPTLIETERIASKKEDVTDEFMQKLQEICRTEVRLYDRFTETWFTYQVARMEPTGDAHILYVNRYVLHHYMGGYAQNLAMRSAQLNQGMLSNGEISEGETLFWNLWTPWSPNSKEFHRDESVEKQLFPQDENDRNEGRLRNLKLLRDSCLLRYESGAKKFRFLHMSLFEYFLSREVFEKYRGALNYYSNWNKRREGVNFLINGNDITDPVFSGVLSMLVGRAETDETFQSTLLEAIKRSATLPGIEQMASNALTILNLSGYSFSGRNKDGDNFQNIQVPGANFRNSICGNSDFSGANFKNAKLNQGWFQGCKFQGANFLNCSLGQIPPISLDLQTFLIHDVLCCKSHGFEHVIICCEEQSPSTENAKLYVKNYKLNENFQFVECKSFFAQPIAKGIEYLFSLVELRNSIILFVFVPRDLEWLSKEVMLPESWYEFGSNSVLNFGKFKETNLNLQHHLKVLKEQNSEQKFILFSPNKLPAFCDEETLKSVSENNRRNGVRPLDACGIKFTWMPFGRFKFIVAISFGNVNEIEGIPLMDNIVHISVLHNWAPILCNNGRGPLEIFWQVDHSENKVTHEKLCFHEVGIHCRGSYFDGDVVLSFPSSENIYFFDFKHNKVPIVLQNTPFPGSFSINNSTTSKRKRVSRYIILRDSAIPRHIVNIATSRSRGCFVSKEFDFIALKKLLSTKVFSVENGTFSQIVLKDFQTPISFKRSKGSTYLVYIAKGSLHFEKIEVIDLVPKKNPHTKLPVQRYFSEDGSIGIVFPLTARIPVFDVWKFQNEANGHRRQETFDRRIQYRNFRCPKFHTTAKAEVLITPNNLVVYYVCVIDPLAPGYQHQLNAYDAKCNKIFRLHGIPYDRMSTRTNILMFQDFQKIAFKNDKEFACYSVTETPYGGIGLVHDVTFTCSFERPEFAFDPNEQHTYVFSKINTYNGRIGVWNLENSTYMLYQVKNHKIFQPNTSQCTVLLENKIIQGCCRNGYFYINRSKEYSKFHPESPVYVSSNSKLGWIVSQFRNGDLVILESRSLEQLFFFYGFLPGHKFQITLKSPHQVRIALVQDYAGELVWLSLNGVSLGQCYQHGKLKEFKDWKVDKSDLPSSSLSLSKVDISYSRSIDKGFLSLFNFHGSLGSPSESHEYKPFCNLFLPVIEYQHSILITSDNEQPIDLSKNWTVTVITKKSKSNMPWISTEPHAALIIEGILHGRHFVIRAELTNNNKVLQIKCESYRGKSQYEEIVKNYDGKQIQVDSEIGMKLLQNIWVDTYNPQWKYNLLFHNCNSWCKEKLQVLNIEDEFKSKPYRLFVDLPKDFELKEFKFSKSTHQNVK